MIRDENNLKAGKNNEMVQENGVDTWHLVAEGDWLSGQRFDVHGYAVLGRESSCDITIPGTHLSRRHAELAVQGNILQIRDLGSSNGTYVNNIRVEGAELHHGDKVQFDVLIFRVIAPIQLTSLDNNATNVRLVSSIASKPEPKYPSQHKTWAAKPTAEGNREFPTYITASQKAVRSFWTLLALITGVITITAIGYLLTQL